MTDVKKPRRGFILTEEENLRESRERGTALEKGDWKGTTSSPC